MEDEQFLRRVESIAQEIESCTDPALRSKLRGVVETLLDFHGRALGRLMEHLDQSGQSVQSTLNALAGDDLVSSLLLLHDLHPWDTPTRLRKAIERAAPSWIKQGARVELIGIGNDSLVQLKLENLNPHHALASSLKAAIEQVIYAAAPDATGVVIDGWQEHNPGFVPLSAVRIPKRG